MIIGKVYSLDEYEQDIVYLAAEQRHNNKIKLEGWQGIEPYQVPNILRVIQELPAFVIALVKLPYAPALGK